MNQSASLGMNKTGGATAPQRLQEMVSGTELFLPQSTGSARAIADVRIAYAAEAEPIGSVPMPASLTGTLKTAAIFWRSAGLGVQRPRTIARMRPSSSPLRCDNSGTLSSYSRQRSATVRTIVNSSAVQERIRGPLKELQHLLIGNTDFRWQPS